MTKIRLLAVGILLATSCALAAAEKSRVVATVGRTIVTEEQLDRAVGNRLLRVHTDEYNIRRMALDTIVDDRLIADEAARRNITVDELLENEIKSSISAPTASEIEPFYEAARERFGNASPEEAMKQIAENMRQQRVAKRRAEFVASLRKAAGVRVLIEPPRASVEAVGPSRGRNGAPVTIVEFSDFECPFCGRAATTIRKLEETYGENVRVVYLDFPLESHRGAPRAAEAAHCAEEQGKFWEMHDRLYSKGGGPVTDAEIRKYVSDVGLDGPKFNACLESGKHTATWKASVAEGQRIGVGSTPTFFINGRMVAGAAPYEMFVSIIDEEIGRAGGREQRRSGE